MDIFRPARLQEEVRGFNASLAKGEATAGRQVVEEYARSMDTLRGKVDALTEQIASKRELGEEVSPSWLFREERYKSLIKQTEQEVVRLSVASGGQIERWGNASVQQAVEHSKAMVLADLQDKALDKGMVRAVMGRWDDLPSDVAQTLVGTMQPGTPLHSLLSDNGTHIVQDVKSALVQGVVEGTSLDKVARDVERAMGGGLSRSMTIARTETFRATREATRATYEKNSDIVSGWEWRCARTAETCAVCWAMDGEIFNTGDFMPAHINCRCTLVPKTRTWEELGFSGVPEVPSPVPSADEAFAALSEEDKHRILGASKYEAFSNGDLELGQLVGFRHDEDWGGNVYERKLSDALDADGPGLRGTWQPPTFDEKGEIVSEHPTAARFIGAKNVEERDRDLDTRMQGWADKRGISLEEYKALCDERAREICGTGEIHIRVPNDVLELIMADGRFKSQFETSTSGGALAPQIRKEAEAFRFGLPHSLPDAQRPIYGYLLDPKQVGQDWPAEQYGNVVVRLDSSVRDRTTVMVDDSLNGYSRQMKGTAEALQPVPLNEPSHRMFRYGDDDPLGEVTSPTMSMGSQGVYTEIQVHGGLPASDIRQVTFTGRESTAATNSLERAFMHFEDYGIDWDDRRT